MILKIVLSISISNIKERLFFCCKNMLIICKNDGSGLNDIGLILF